jgi:hypothetical protein
MDQETFQRLVRLARRCAPAWMTDGDRTDFLTRLAVILANLTVSPDPARAQLLREQLGTDHLEGAVEHGRVADFLDQAAKAVTGAEDLVQLVFILAR